MVRHPERTGDNRQVISVRLDLALHAIFGYLIAYNDLALAADEHYLFLQRQDVVFADGLDGHQRLLLGLAVVFALAQVVL